MRTMSLFGGSFFCNKVTDNTTQQMNQLPDVVCESQNSLKWISRTGLLVSHRVRLVESLE